jgi:serine/threonine protein phosphatase PrpC
MVAALDSGPEVAGGSTATIAAAWGEHMAVAWLGDSTGVLVSHIDKGSGKEGGTNRAWSVEAVTRDHQPLDPAEQARVRTMGGMIRAQLQEMDSGEVVPFGIERVWDATGRYGLAVTRALGDHAFRPFVSHEPEVFLRARLSSDAFLLLCSDGVWDVMTQEVESIAHTHRCERDTYLSIMRGKITHARTHA